MTSDSTSSSTMEEWDLTSKLSPFLDRHMMFPLLEYLDSLINAGTCAYQSKDVAAARLVLLRPTHMVDYAIDIYKNLHPEAEIPQEMLAQKEKVYQDLEELKKACQPLEDLAQNQEEKAKLVAAGMWNIGAIAAYNITPDMVDTYRRLAKYNFECGDYKASRDQLEVYISLLAKPPPTKDEEDEALNPNAPAVDAVVGQQNMYYLEYVNLDLLTVLWGKLAAEVLVEDWEAARIALEAVQAALETLVASKELLALDALQQRTWLLHWSLFVYWNAQQGGLETLVDLFHSERYKQAITTNAPHLLRYLTAAVLLCKRRITKKASMETRRLLKNLTSVMAECDYSDPIVEFVHNLCVVFDFDKAQIKLAECERVLQADFFLCKQTALFMEEARVFVFENYCRIHNKIDLRTLGEKLAMDQEAAERWIVDLIRNADFQAKIDSSLQCVVMGTDTQSIYEQVMERTRDLNVRSATLTQNLQNLLNEARKEKAKKERAARDEGY